MKDVKATLALAWIAAQAVIEGLKEIAATNDFTSEAKLDNEVIEASICQIADLEEQLSEAKLRLAGWLVTTAYAIGKETAPGEYSGFTHGPIEDRNELTKTVDYIGTLEDGDAFVRIVTGGGVVNYVTEAIWLDGKWNETGDELKEASA